MPQQARLHFRRHQYRRNPSSPVYNASKVAVGAFSDVLRQEVAERDVRVIVTALLQSTPRCASR